MAEVAHSGLFSRQPQASDRPGDYPSRPSGVGAVAAGSAIGRQDQRIGQPVRSAPAVVDRARPMAAPWPGPWSPQARPGWPQLPLAADGGGPAAPAPGRAWTHAPNGAGKQPPEHLLPILAQLLTGATDVTASQRLGMSPRTFSRRVSELLDCLGVLSRFQAGVAAVDQGWIVPRQYPHRRPGR